MTGISDYFDGLADSWDSEAHAVGDMQKMVACLAGVGEGTRVLDLGCGTGIMEQAYISACAREIVALDVSPKMIERARAKFAIEKHVSFLCEDALDYQDAVDFDVVVIYNAYPHILEREKLVERVASLLKPGGRFIVAHGMGREKLNSIHSSVPSAVRRELGSVDAEKKIWETRFSIDVQADLPSFYCFGGTLR